MDQKNKNNIFIDNAGGELTFGKIFTVLKCSLMRMLVYVIIACILAGCISVALTLTASTSTSVDTTIEFSYNGIGKGLTPDGNKFNKDTIKDINVLNSAIEKLDSKSSTLNVNSLYSRLHVTEVIPANILAQIEDLKDEQNKVPDKNAQLSKLEYYPTRFTVTINDYQSLGLKENEAKTLLGNIITVYREKWQEIYVGNLNISNSLILSTNKDFENALKLSDPTIDDNGLLEYMNYKTMIDSALSEIDNYLKNNSKINFVSTKGHTYKSIQDRVTVFKTAEYDPSIDFILGMKIIKNKDRVVAALSKAELSYKAELSNNDETIRKLDTQITSIQPNITTTETSTGGSTIKEQIYPPIYFELLQERKNLTLRNAALSSNIDKIAIAKAAIDSGINTDPVVELDAIKSLKSCTDSLLEIYDEIAELDKEYKSTEPLSNAVYSVTPVSGTTSGGVSKTAILLTFVLPIFIAIVAAIVVTVKLQKKFAFDFLKKKSETETKPLDTEEEQEEKKED